MTGYRIRASPRSLKLRISSSQTRHNQPAKSVYQIQPPWPTRPGKRQMSSAMAYGSTLYLVTCFDEHGIFRVWAYNQRARGAGHVILSHVLEIR